MTSSIPISGLATTRLAYFTTDADGNGSFHFDISSGDLTAGTRNIQVALNVGTSTSLIENESTIGTTVAATEKYTLLQVQ